MSFRDYLSGKAVPLCMAGIGGMYLALAAYLFRIPGALLLLLLACGVLGVAVWLIIGWRYADSRLRRLRRQLKALPDKYLIGEILDRPKGALELEYYGLLQEISRSAIGAVEEAQREKQDYLDYVECWVHELKTPLTAASLILSNGGDQTKLRRELRRADNLTETILTYAKLKTAEKDTQISRVQLRGLCDQAIREEMELLIAAGISVSIEGDSEAYTDAKGFVFVLKQLLINCAKYCAECRIRIDISERGLSFEDDGPGIAAHELKRVTQRGFTGEAGRKQGQSTGMGLYIVSRLCEKLNVTMTISSEPGAYTRFFFCFPSPTLQNCQTADRRC